MVNCMKFISNNNNLRQQLEDRLSKEGLKGNGGDLLKQMEGIEQQLLDKGFNQRTLEQMLNLQYELLKLDKADFEQGQESKRESRSNRNRMIINLRLSPEDVKKYFNTTEILNREALPLRRITSKKFRPISRIRMIDFLYQTEF